MKKSRFLGVLAAAAVAVSAFAALPTSAAETYKAYFGCQSQSYTFRNKWNEPSYGLGVTGDNGMVYFDTLTGWDASNNAVDMGGDFTDVDITGDGTYTVGLSGDFDFGNDETFNLLFASTNIPLSTGATVSNVNVKFDGNTIYTFDEGYVDEEETEYVYIPVINTYNPDLKDLFAYAMPSTSIELEFTISGLGSAAADTGAETDTPAADSGATTSATTGNLPVAVMVTVTAVAGAAAIASRKRK